jgi:tetratricopeptide (TPR) repeat protein
VNSDTQKVGAIAFGIVVPLLIVTLSYGVLKGDGDPIQSVKDARRPRNIIDDLSDVHLNYSQGKWEEALKAAKLVLKRDPSHEDTLRIVADCEFQLKRPGAAAVAMKKILKEIPEDVETRIVLAQTLAKLNQRDEAEEQWKKVAESPYATRKQQRQAREALDILNDPLGGLFPPTPASSPSPEGKTGTNRVQ